MLIRWTVPAFEDAQKIVAHLRERSPDLGAQVMGSILTSVERLLTFPNLGRLGTVEGTREVLVGPYVIVYRVRSECIELLRIWHGAQNRQ
jgi:toxin ParE1/3/4